MSRIVGWQVRSKLGPEGWDHSQFMLHEPMDLNEQYEKRALGEYIEPPARHEIPLNITKEDVFAFEAYFYGRHERGFILKPLIGPPDFHKALQEALDKYHEE